MFVMAGLNSIGLQNLYLVLLEFLQPNKTWRDAVYGLVNRAMKEMVTEQFGNEAWIKIIDRDESIPNEFGIFAQYDDFITANIVGNICEDQKINAEDFLVDFGRYWVKYAKKSDYKGILEVFASSPTFLIKSLDSLHTRLTMLFENLSPPSFSTEEPRPGLILVNYSSDRNLPLEYFVKGLLVGIFELFDQQCKVNIVSFREEGEAAVFEVHYE